jgi:sterol desaturase/sphingolipid hydroxylase (fatty acid hydroxylase superfamily)
MMENLWTELGINVIHTLEDYLIYASAAFVLFYIILRKVLSNRKIQQKFPKWKDYRRDFIFSMITVAIFATIALVVFDILFEYTNMYKDISDRSTAYYIFSYVGMFFIHDTYFYWVHRLMHHPRLYRSVHLVHHKSTNPSPWTAYAFHPLEAVLEAGIIPVIAFTLPVHREALGWFFLFQVIYNVYGHLGYELYPKNFHKTWIGRYVNTSVAHNVHHKYFTGNYGLYTLIWDRLMGTINRNYDRVYEETTERSGASSSPQSRAEYKIPAAPVGASPPDLIDL